MPTSMRLFISYSHEDADFVARLKADLQKAGADIWIDHERLQPGTPDWEAAVREGIAQASAIIYVASPSGASSRFVRDELGLARGKGRRVIPLWVRGEEWHDAAPLGWGSTQYIDARSFRYASALDELLRTLGLVAPAPPAPVVQPVRPPTVSSPETPAPSDQRPALPPVTPPATPRPSAIPSHTTPIHRPATHTRRPRRWRLIVTSVLVIAVVAATTLTILSKINAVPSSTVRWKTSTGNHVNSSPTVANGEVYVGSWDFNVYALDASTGAVRWKTPTGEAVESSPAFANGVVYVGSDDFYVYALDASSGAVRWKTPTGSFVGSSPTVVNGVVYVGSEDDNVYALDAATGTVRWKTPTGGEVNSSPAVANGLVYVGSDDGYVYAIAA